VSRCSSEAPLVFWAQSHSSEDWRVGNPMSKCPSEVSFVFREPSHSSEAGELWTPLPNCSCEVSLVFRTRTRGFVWAIQPVHTNLPIKQPTKPHIILVSSMERIAKGYGDAESVNLTSQNSRISQTNQELLLVLGISGMTK